jgi:hypothetical protein
MCAATSTNTIGENPRVVGDSYNRTGWSSAPPRASRTPQPGAPGEYPWNMHVHGVGRDLFHDRLDGLDTGLPGRDRAILEATPVQADPEDLRSNLLLVHPGTGDLKSTPAAGQHKHRDPITAHTMRKKRAPTNRVQRHRDAHRPRGHSSGRSVAALAWVRASVRTVNLALCTRKCTYSCRACKPARDRTRVVKTQRGTVKLFAGRGFPGGLGSGWGGWWGRGQAAIGAQPVIWVQTRNRVVISLR